MLHVYTTRIQVQYHNLHCDLQREQHELFGCLYNFERYYCIELKCAQMFKTIITAYEKKRIRIVCTERINSMNMICEIVYEDSYLSLSNHFSHKSARMKEKAKINRTHYMKIKQRQTQIQTNSKLLCGLSYCYTLLSGRFLVCRCFE